MKCFFIDYENVKNDGIKELKNLENGDLLFIFYSETCKNIPIEVMEMIMQKNLQFKSYKVQTGTKNALDFQLASHLGYVIGSRQDITSYFIVSNDRGFDCLCEFWKGQNVSLERLMVQKKVSSAETDKMTNLSEEKKSQKVSGEKEQKEQKEKKAKSKVSAGNLATLEEIREYLSEEDMPQEVLEIFNQYKSKQAICNGISKKCKDSKRTSAIYKKLKPLLREKKKS